MKDGLLWFDPNNKKALQEKVEEACARYREKFGEVPNCCYVNPGTVHDDTRINGVVVKRRSSILPNHFWVGVEQNDGSE